ncbi:hypothetical protein AVEN_109579-1 [Araneus ventricosus]|uniref:Uncharacterized protein n=1 Tax=Araneus ventricosus TaxID=182803 RepID=A0A4Y2DEE3_ARAVE|nr:hypothetical protein AVEN_41392-1 [Araneus ventricosus]GBM14507.1 hypothetical protein AVEN_109579-1 [Araneus ventricosus]
MFYKFFFHSIERISLDILTSRFKAMEVQLWDGFRHFEPRSDNTSTGAPSPNFRTTPAGESLSHYVLLPRYTTDLQWDRVSNLELSEAETLPLVLRVPIQGGSSGH